ncbi:MAG: monovalent cation/H+ antiporter subunit D family protein, partial [Candidatus Subteraquimicrobiales bacterium]|nr:monovalent cation/H+ antiporter subunit D family protein [Candidatus Subteraquimicrobiales bacterium]
MFEQKSLLPVLTVAFPFLMTLAIFIWGRVSAKLRNYLSILAAIGTFALSLTMVSGSLKGTIFVYKLMQIVPGIWFYFRVDQLGLVFAVTASLLWVLSVTYSVSYMEDEHAQRRYFCFLILCLTWTLGVALSGNLFTFFIFYELFSISTYPLIVHEESPEALAAGKKYMIYILIGAAFVLFSLVFTYVLAGDLTFNKAGLMSMEMGRDKLMVLFWTFVLGFGVKAAIMPMHGWVPDAHPIAPAPFIAILSGIMVGMGCFGLMRSVFNIIGASIVKELGTGLILAYIVCFTIIVSSLLALEQDNLKRRLAYSTIGQMGYVILGVALLVPYSVWGGILHVVNHAFMKGLLFLCAGTIIKKLGKKNVSEMRGIGQKLPVTMGVFTIAAFSMIGLPPLAGFTSKWFLCLGSIDAPHGIIFVIVLLISSLLGAAYFLPIIYTAFFQKPLGEIETRHEDEEAKESYRQKPEAS